MAAARIARQVAIAARREALVERALEAIALSVVAIAVLYILAGTHPFEPDIDPLALPTNDVSPVNRWIWLGLLGLCLPILWLRWRQALALLPRLWPLLLLYAWFALTTTWALDHASSTRRFLLYVVALAIFMAVSLGCRSKRRLHLTIALAGGAIMLVDIGAWVVVPRIAMSDLGFVGMHPQKNVAGVAALYTLFALLPAVPLVRGRIARIGFATAAAAGAVVLIASRSATSIILGLAAAAVIPVLLLVVRRSRALIAIAATGLVLVLAAALFGYYAWAGVTGADPWAPLRDITFTGRTDLWAFLRSEIAQRPFTGYGFGSFWAIDPMVQPSLRTGAWFASAGDMANEGHNGYLDLTATTGLIGLAGAVLVLLRSIGHGLRAVAAVPARPPAGRPGALTLPTATFHLAFLLVMAFHNMLESTYFTANTIFGTMFLLSAIELEAWRLAARRPVSVPRPAPVPAVSGRAAPAGPGR